MKLARSSLVSVVLSQKKDLSKPSIKNKWKNNTITRDMDVIITRSITQNIILTEDQDPANLCASCPLLSFPSLFSFISVSCHPSTMLWSKTRLITQLNGLFSKDKTFLVTMLRSSKTGDLSSSFKESAKRRVTMPSPSITLSKDSVMHP